MRDENCPRNHRLANDTKKIDFLEKFLDGLHENLKNTKSQTE